MEKKRKDCAQREMKNAHLIMQIVRIQKTRLEIFRSQR